MNLIFFLLIVISILCGIAWGTLDNVMNAMFHGCDTAIKISFSLIGIMAFWLGLLKIAEKSGLVNIIAKLILPVTKILFKDDSKNNSAMSGISMSLVANALGLTNAATPIGIRVMKDLQKNNLNKDVATDSMCMFLAMNTAGFQLIPATVIAILIGLGAKNPTEIILPTLIVTSLSFLCAIILAMIFRRYLNND